MLLSRTFDTLAWMPERVECLTEPPFCYNPVTEVTQRFGYGCRLARLTLGELSGEEVATFIKGANGYVREVHTRDSESGEIVIRHDLTAAGMDVVRRFAWPIITREVEVVHAKRGVFPDQIPLFED